MLDRRFCWHHDLSLLFFLSEEDTTVFIKNGEGLNSMRCRSVVVQIDTQFTIRSIELGALKRFSFDEITSENYHSERMVLSPENLKSGDVLLFEGADSCLRVGSFKSYDPKRHAISLELPSNITFDRASTLVSFPSRPPLRKNTYNKNIFSAGSWKRERGGEREKVRIKGRKRGRGGENRFYHSYTIEYPMGHLTA